MEFKSRRKPIWDYLYIIIGTTLIGAAINMFLDPLEMVTGGVTGIAIIIKGLSGDLITGGIPLWLTNIIINIPLFIAGYLIYGRQFIGKSLFSTFYLSAALYYTQFIPVITEDLLLGSVFAGVLSGLGLGLVFLAYSTTGGTDLGGSILHHFFKHVSIAKLMMTLDVMIILGGLFVFGPEKSLYAIISIYITTKMVDSILDGFNYSKAAFIISDHNDNISGDIINKLDRGATGLHGQGMYTKMNKNILLVVVAKKEIIKLKEIVKQRDANAFVIVTDVREVLGEGFNEYKDK